METCSVAVFWIIALCLQYASVFRKCKIILRLCLKILSTKMRVLPHRFRKQVVCFVSAWPAPSYRSQMLAQLLIRERLIDSAARNDSHRLRCCIPRARRPQRVIFVTSTYFSGLEQENAFTATNSHNMRLGRFLSWQHRGRISRGMFGSRRVDTSEKMKIYEMMCSKL